MVSSLNSTLKVLIPKKFKPTFVNEFWPINLYNVVYKLVSKLLTSRMKPYMHSIISNNQSTFISRRLITDNVMIAHEILHTMKQNTNGRFVTMEIKLDMLKAYDRVECPYLEEAMKALGFNDHWQKLVMACVFSISYLILLNGRPTWYFKPSRGLQ